MCEGVSEEDVVGGGVIFSFETFPFLIPRWVMDFLFSFKSEKKNEAILFVFEGKKEKQLEAFFAPNWSVSYIEHNNSIDYPLKCRVSRIKRKEAKKYVV